MNAAFLPPASFLPLRQTRLQTCKRCLQKRVHYTPTSLAKYQQQETNESPESETPLEEIIPPPALPTLTTLTGKAQKQELPIDQPQSEIDLSQLSNQGPALSREQENAVMAFLKGVAEEFQLVEWPSFERVVRLTVIILLTIVITVSALYFVDGFFYRMASIVFEGKI